MTASSNIQSPGGQGKGPQANGIVRMTRLRSHPGSSAGSTNTSVPVLTQPLYQEDNSAQQRGKRKTGHKNPSKTNPYKGRSMDQLQRQYTQSFDKTSDLN